MHTVKKKAEASAVVTKESGIAVTADKTKQVVRRQEEVIIQYIV